MNDKLKELNIKLDDKFDGLEIRLTEMRTAVEKCQDRLNMNIEGEEMKIQAEGEGTRRGSKAEVCWWV